MIFKHKFKVIYSKTPLDTVNILLDIDKKKELTDFEYGKNDIGFTSNKKSDVTKNNSLACQLSTITGVSPSIATILQNEYKTTKNLIDSFETKISLKDIKVTEKRKLGPKLSEKIYDSLF